MGDEQYYHPRRTIPDRYTPRTRTSPLDPVRNIGTPGLGGEFQLQVRQLLLTKEWTPPTSKPNGTTCTTYTATPTGKNANPDTTRTPNNFPYNRNGGAPVSFGADACDNPPGLPLNRFPSRPLDPPLTSQHEHQPIPARPTRTPEPEDWYVYRCSKGPIGRKEEGSVLRLSSERPYK